MLRFPCGYHQTARSERPCRYVTGWCGCARLVLSLSVTILLIVHKSLVVVFCRFQTVEMNWNVKPIQPVGLCNFLNFLGKGLQAIGWKNLIIARNMCGGVNFAKVSVPSCLRLSAHCSVPGSRGFLPFGSAGTTCSIEKMSRHYGSHHRRVGFLSFHEYEQKVGEKTH